MNKTNNEIMFLCERDLFTGSPAALPQVKEFIASYYKFNGTEFEENFSLDNWKLVACWLWHFYKTCKPVPVFDRHSWRVWDNLPFFIFCKNPTVFFFLRPIIGFWCIVSVLRVKKVNSRGFVEITTSGDIMAYFVCRFFGLNWTFAIMTFFVKRNKHLKSWENIFKIYFPKNHYVLNALTRKLG